MAQSPTLMRGLVGLCLAYWTRWTIFWLKRLDLYLNRFCRDGILGREISNSNVQPKDFKPFVLLLTSEVHGSSPKGFSVSWMSSGREGYFLLYWYWVLYRFFYTHTQLCLQYDSEENHPKWSDLRPVDLQQNPHHLSIFPIQRYFWGYFFCLAVSL